MKERRYYSVTGAKKTRVRTMKHFHVSIVIDRIPAIYTFGNSGYYTVKLCRTTRLSLPESRIGLGLAHGWRTPFLFLIIVAFGCTGLRDKTEQCEPTVYIPNAVLNRLAEVGTSNWSRSRFESGACDCYLLSITCYLLLVLFA